MNLLPSLVPRKMMKEGSIDMLSEAKKRANNKWDAANMKNVACRLRKDIAEQFSAVAKANGTTPNEILRICIMEYLANHQVAAEVIPEPKGEPDEPTDIQ